MTDETSTPRRGLLRRIWGLLPMAVLLVLVGLIFLMADQIKTKGAVLKEAKQSGLVAAQPPVNVVALDVTPGPIRDRISLPGMVAPWVRLDVLVEVRGKVVRRAVSDGQRVKKGDVLLEIDPRDYQNAYNSAKTAHEVAAAAIKRLEKLHAESLSTRSQLDNATAQVESTRAAMDSAALQLERCTVRAPIAGVINNLYVELGQYLNPADPVAEILQLDRVKVIVGIPESDVDAVRRLNEFDVQIDALDGRVFRGTTYHLSKTADQMARLYNLKLEVANPDGLILPDMFARVHIVKRQVDEALAVPLYAVINHNSHHSLFVVEDERAVERTVALGLQEGWRVQITEGLDAGDRVIVVGHRSVTADQKVKVVRSIADPQEAIQ